MSKDLKRVGLVFDSEGQVDFVKSLKQTNATLNENYTQFQKVKSLYDNQTKTVDKLRDKQKYLNQAYDTTKSKVNVLRAELEELENAEERNETAILKKKSALNKAETSLNRYQKQLDEVNKSLKTANLDDFSKKLDTIGTKLENAGKKMSAFSVAIGGAFGLAANSAIQFQSDFTDVAKTVDATTLELEALESEIRQMALSIPATTSEISAVASLAGQLGIETENIMSFTRVMIDLGNASNISAEEASSALAKFANITQMSQKDFDRLGSSITALGNNFATTESDIVNMSQNLAAAGSQIGMSNSDILALATTLSSLGLEAQAGGTAFSKLMVEMQLAVETGSDSLDGFAKVAGMTGEQFQKAFKDDATSALNAFIIGLGSTGEQGESAIKVLDDLGISETRLRDALLRTANANTLFTDALEMSSTAWDENTALADEANKRYETVESQMQILKNTVNEVGISFGELLLPILISVVENLQEFLLWINNLDPAMKGMILTIGGIVLGIGPLLIFIGKIAQGVGGLISLFTFISGTALPAISSVLGTLLANPVVLIIGVIVLAIAGLIWALGELGITTEDIWNFVTGIFQGFDDFLTSIFTTDWTENFGAIGEIFNGFSKSVEDIWNSIKDIFSGIITFIEGVFSGDWEKAWTGVKDIFGGIFDMLVSIVKTPINAIIGFLNMLIAGVETGVNYLIKTINKLSWKVPNWVPIIGGEKFGFDFSQVSLDRIPLLAQGGNLLNGIAIAGEAGPEMLLNSGGSTQVIPLSQSTKNSRSYDIFDYKQMAKEFFNVFKSARFEVGEDGLGKFVEDKLLEVME